MENDTRLRLIYIQRMLENTDERQPITSTEINRRLLEDYGITVHRFTITTDIELLIKAGMPIAIRNTKPKQYYLTERANQFSLPELKLLVDAVSSSKFITKAKSDELVKKITELATPTEKLSLNRNLWAEGRIKQENEKIYAIIDAINSAINQNSKISFQYFQYDVRKKQKLKHNGQVYKCSPYALVWNGDYYYMVAYSEKHGNIGNFRIDRISQTPKILAEASVPLPPGFDMAEYTNGMFNMYNSDRVDVELICDNSVMDSIIDKFGVDAKTYAYDMTSFRLEANVAVTHIFFSWIFGFGGKVKINAPEAVRMQYESMRQSAFIKEKTYFEWEGVTNKTQTEYE